jgi:hypothetical protein
LGLRQKNDRISENVVFARKSECLKLIPQPLLLAREGEQEAFFTPSLKKKRGGAGVSLLIRFKNNKIYPISREIINLSHTLNFSSDLQMSRFVV